MHRFLPILLLASAVAIGFVLLFDMRGLAVPPYYNGDALYFLQATKNVVLFRTPFFGEVGAPFPPELVLFPGVSILWIVIINAIALFTDDVFAINNLFVIVVTVLHGLAFYLVARWLGVRRALAWIGGVAFSFLPFAISRAFVHQALVPMVAVPIAGYLSLLTLYCPRRFSAAGVNSYSTLLCNWTPPLLLGFLIGASGHYWTAFACLFILASGGIAACSSRRATPFVFASALVAAILTSFLLSHAPTLLLAVQTAAPLPPAPRSPQDQVLYGLRVADLFVPLDADLVGPRRLLEYYRGARFPKEGEGRDAFLGPLGLLGFLLITAVLLGSFSNCFGRQRPLFWGIFRYRAIAGAAVLSVVGILFSLSNGFGNLFHLFVSPVLRAQNRVSVFLAFFAIIAVLLLLEGLFRRQRISRTPRVIATISLAVFAAAAIWFQTSFFSFNNSAEISARAVNADRHFFAEFERKLGAGRQVLQLPIMAFPGVPPLVDLADYEHFRGPIQTSGNRWSYGTMIARPALRWQQDLAARPPQEMVARARAAGFDVIIIERRGYVDKAETLLQALTRVLGPQALVLNNHERAVFDLGRHQGERHIPVLPEVRYRGFSDLESATDGSGSTYHWDDSPKGVVQIALENYGDAPRPVILTASVVTGYPEPFRFLLTGPGLDLDKVMTNRATFRAALAVPPGINLYRMSTSARRLLAPPDPRSLHFSLWDFRVHDIAYEKAVARYAVE